MPLFKISLPANAETIFAVLFAIAEFDMIPTDTLYEDMQENLEELNPPEDDYLLAKMEPLGFDTVWFLSNLGSILIFFGLWLFFVALSALLSLLIRCTLCCPSIRYRLKKWKLSVRKFTFWNWPITFVRDSYIVIAICSLYNAAYAQWLTKESVLNSGLSILILVVFLVYPALLQLGLYQKQESLLNVRTRRKQRNV